MSMNDTIQNLSDRHTRIYRDSAGDLRTLASALMSCRPPGLDEAGAARAVLGAILPTIVATFGAARTADYLDELAAGLRQMGARS